MKRRLCVMILTACFIAGCEMTDSQKGSGFHPISAPQLRDELDRFEYYFIDSMTLATNEVNAISGTRQESRNELQRRTRIIDALYAMMSPDDSVQAFVDTWGLVVRLRHYIQGGAGSQIYGEHQPRALAFITEAEEEIQRIGKLFINPEQFNETRDGISSFARANPITGHFSNLIVYASKEEAETPGGILATTLRIPMAPIRALEGVDKTGDAIIKVRDSVDNFTGIAQQFPESARWQMSILMEDFEDLEMTQSFLSSLSQFSDSSERLVEVLNSMPADLRKELVTVLEESDQTQQQLQGTLKAAAQASAQLEKTLAEIQTTSLSVNDTAGLATEAAVAWENASESFQDLVSQFKPKEPRSPDAPPRFGMRDFDTMLLNAGQTADKVTHAIVQLQEATGQDGEIKNEFRSLIDHAAMRLFQLLLAAFVLMLILTVIRRKLKTS